MATNNACNYVPIQYSTLTGGANGAINNVSPGTAGQVLTSNGASAQPTFEDAAVGATSGSFLIAQPFEATTLADSTTYYFASTLNAVHGTINSAATKFLITSSVTLTKCYGITRVNGTLGSSGNSTFSILVNGTSSTTVSSTVKFDAADGSFSNTGLSIALVAGDYVQFRIATPAFSTNPTDVSLSITAFIS